MNSKKTVLLIDDDKEFLEEAAEALSSEGYRVVVCIEASEALKKIKTEQPDIVLLDILMPDADGIEILKKIRRRYKELPVFMLTGFADEKRFEAAKKFKASGFINKTNNFIDKLNTINSALMLADKYKRKKGSIFSRKKS